jgi:hypothetical protein
MKTTHLCLYCSCCVQYLCEEKIDGLETNHSFAACKCALLKKVFFAFPNWVISIRNVLYLSFLYNFVVYCKPVRCENDICKAVKN